MRPPSYALSLMFGSILLTSCAGGGADRVLLHPTMDGFPGTSTRSLTTAQFMVPQHWNSSETNQPESGRYALISQARPSGVIDILFSRPDPTAPTTQEGQVEGYLDAVHHHTDPDVRMEFIGEVQHPSEGPVRLYYLHSDYFHHRLYAVIIHGSVMFSAELFCQSEMQVPRDRPALDAVLRSVVFP